jgi:hypothetical protein
MALSHAFMLRRFLTVVAAVAALAAGVQADGLNPPQSVPAVPEPATLLLLGSGLAVAAYGLRKARKR